MKFTSKQKKQFLAKYGSWALVTGASSGIGLAITEALANMGFNLIIHSRNQQTLDQLKQKLELHYQVKVNTVASDLTHQLGIDAVIQATKHITVGLVVLSAGFGSSGLFTASSIHTERNMLQLNCEAVLSMSHYFSQLFEQQKKGGIILLSSIVAFQGVPLSANYAATKAYIQTLAEGIARELKSKGVDVLAAAPGPVKTGFAQRANMEMSMFLTPESIAIPILKALGKQTTVFPGRLTKLLIFALSTVPRWAKILIMEKVMAGMTAHQRNTLS